MCQASTVVFISPSDCQDVQVSSLSLSLCVCARARLCVCVCLGARRGVECGLDHWRPMPQCCCVSSFSGGSVLGRAGRVMSQDADGRHHITPPAPASPRSAAAEAMQCRATRCESSEWRGACAAGAARQAMWQATEVKVEPDRTCNAYIAAGHTSAGKPRTVPGTLQQPAHPHVPIPQKGASLHVSAAMLNARR